MKCVWDSFDPSKWNSWDTRYQEGDNNMTQRLLLPATLCVFALALLFAASVAAGAGDAVTSASSTPAAGGVVGAPPLPDVPLDTNLVPVSRSNPSPEAKTALELCVRPGDEVAGMARLASARDVQKYMLTNGREPELQVGVPVWVVQLRGAITYPFGTVLNPVCVVKDGDATIYLPYGSADASGWSPPSDFVGPRFALPPLAP